MKSTLLTTAAAVALLALPSAAVASPPDLGMVQGGLGVGWTNDDFNNWEPFDDPVTYGARTQWLFPLSKPVELQADFFVEQMTNIFDNSQAWNDEDSTLFGGTAHLIHSMEHGRLGVAGSIYSVDAFGPFLGKNGTGKGVVYGLVALEGQYFTEHWTFFGQGGWFSDIGGCDGLEGCIHDAFFLRANATYFLSPYNALNLDGSLFFGDDGFFGQVQGGTARLEGEHMFEGSRFSAFLGVSYEQQEMDVPWARASEDTTTVDIGVRLYLDQMSLVAFSQDGPSMNTPTFHHVLATEGTLQLEVAP